MRYKLFDLINGVGDFDIVDNILYFAKGNFLQKYPFVNLINLDKYWGIKFMPHFLNVFDQNSFNTFYSYDGKKLKELEQKNIFHFFTNDSFIYFDRTEKCTKFNLQKIHEGKLGRPLIVNSNYLTSVEGSSLKTMNYQTNEFQWSFSLESLGTFTNMSNEGKSYEVWHFIGVWNNYLLVQLLGESLLVLDLESGELIKQIKFSEYVELPNGNYLDSYPKMQIENDTLIWLSHQNLFHVNLIDFSVKNVLNYFETEREKQFRFFSNTLLDGKIYFCADYGWQYITPSRIGVMDAYTGELLWQEQLEKTGGLPDAPQVAGDKLYIRTVNKDLYIFELEKE